MSHSSQAHLPPSLFESETAFFPPNPITDPWGRTVYSIYLHFPQKIYQGKITQIPSVSHGSIDLSRESLIQLTKGQTHGKTHRSRHARAFQKARRSAWENGEARSTGTTSPPNAGGRTKCLIQHHV